jgi:hypothetical protein
MAAEEPAANEKNGRPIAKYYQVCSILWALLLVAFSALLMPLAPAPDGCLSGKTGEAGEGAQ